MFSQPAAFINFTSGMKLSWIFVILLLVFVAVFSVQNAAVVTVRFLVWEITLSAALVIQLAALLGALVGLTVGYWLRPAKRAESAPAFPVNDNRRPIDGPH
jgi:uncharacterized integral membrane protein